MDVGRAFPCGGVQLLIQEGVVLPVEILRRSSDSSRANRAVDSTLPSLGSIIFHKIVLEINPRTRFVVEFWQGDLVGCSFQRFCELGDGGVGESGVGASHGVRAAAGAVGVGGQLLGGRPC